MILDREFVLIYLFIFLNLYCINGSFIQTGSDFASRNLKSIAFERPPKLNSLVCFYKPQKKISTSSSSNQSESGDPSFAEQLREAAKDPKKFEEFVLKSSKNKKEKNGKAFDVAETSDEVPKQEKKKTKYVRVEEWDEELKKKKDGSGMTWEEKVQFDGLRYGNQVIQNDILQKNLNRF